MSILNKLELIHPPHGQLTTLLPEEATPVIVLFDPAPDRPTLARSIAKLNYLTLAVDSSRADNIDNTLDTICPLPDGSNRLYSLAIVLEAYHSVNNSIPARALAGVNRAKLLPGAK
jgi:hypothetical protein